MNSERTDLGQSKAIEIQWLWANHSTMTHLLRAVQFNLKLFNLMSLDQNCCINVKL